MLESKNTIIVYKNYAEIILKDRNDKEIGRAKIDVYDVDKVKDIRWLLFKNTNGYKYAYNPKIGYLSNYILDTKEDESVNYVDGDRLNCKRNNLKINKHTSKYKGVCWDKSCNRWKASIKVNGKSKNLGNFKIEEEAARIYDKAVILYKGVNEELNFPIENYKDYINNLESK